ncbi:hypothetical protein [Flavobacterium faecale]|nr:hypothetical protein [Flavobacterium faecale]
MNKEKLLLVVIGMVILVGGYVFYNNQKQTNDLGTYEDPEVAFKETQKALKVIAAPLNLGMKSVLYIEECKVTEAQIFIKQ